MQIKHTQSSANRNFQVNPNGTLGPNTISRAWNFSSITEDIFIENEKGNHVPFIIIPLSEGEIKVKLAGSSDIYTIAESEVSTFIGSPMLYLIDTVLQNGTTVTSFNIGI